MADTIQEVLQAFGRGELVVVTDDDDRESNCGISSKWPC